MYCNFDENKLVDFETVKKLWKTNTRPVSIYLNNPFCRTNENCKYCVHRGCPKNNHDEQEVQKFYFEYMPMMFEHYKDIISNQKIVLYNFGGGTPNYLSSEDFDKYCSMIPGPFKQTNKVIELHPAFLTEDFINILKKWNFTTLIFCFQTFNENILKEQGREIPDYNNVKKCISLAKSYNMNIASDLITLWNDDWENVLDNDIKELLKFEPDEITISPMYQKKYGTGLDIKDVYSKIEVITNKYFDNYQNFEDGLHYNKNTVALRFFKLDMKAIEDFTIYVNSLTDITWESEQGYSTLGIGTYKNQDKAVFSVIGPDYTFYEQFIDFDKISNLYLMKDWNFWNSCRNIINFFEKMYDYKNPPVDFKIKMENICQNKNLFYDHFNQGEAKTSLEYDWKNVIDQESFLSILLNIDKKMKEIYNN